MTKYIDFALVGELVVHGDVHYEDLMRIPAADVQEVRHGRWIEASAEDPCEYRCSECGWLTDDEWNYCPYCGSRMDLDEVEE